MYSPDDKEAVDGVVMKVQVMRKTDTAREHDIIFTDRGVLFVLVSRALMVGARHGIPNGISSGIGGALGIVIRAAIGPATPHTNEKAREKYGGLTLKQIMENDENNFYLPHLSINAVAVKKRLMGTCGMNFETTEGKIQCEFPKDLLNEVREIVNVRLGSRLS